MSAEVLKGSNIIYQPDRLHSYATIIENENLRLKNQVERVLQMASLEREEISLNKEETQMHQLLSETIEGFKLTHDQVEIKLAF
ncbi:hypothetical protein DF186_17800, partial [Enterococcus hirae]